MMARRLNTGKRQRATYRQALREAGMAHLSRFDEMMLALTGGGSHPCSGCLIVRPAKSLSDSGMCEICLTRIATARASLDELAPTEVEPNVVYTDASYDDGIAGLAIVGAIGEHAKTVPCASSVEAEVMALRWAFEIARDEGYKGLTFRSDCDSAVKQHTGNHYRLGWTVEHVSRRYNGRADHLAGKARLSGYR